MEKKNKTQEIKKKLEYIGLNLEEIPETLKLVEDLQFRPNTGLDEKKYRQYRFVSPKEIQILLSPTNRLDDIKEKYSKATPLANYLDSKSEENQERYATFIRMLEEVKIEDEVSEEVCEECGRNMVVKYGPHGKFLACPGFPDCRNTKPYYEKIGVSCPKCGKDVVLKKTKKGRKYYGCIDNPECDFMSWQKPSNIRCKQCGGYMVEKGKKLVCADKECGFVMDKEEVK